MLLSKVNEEVFSAIMKVHVTSIKRIHRLGKKLAGRTRPVNFRAADYRDKTRILNCSRLKGTNHSISEDFLKRVAETSKSYGTQQRRKGKKAAKSSLFLPGTRKVMKGTNVAMNKDLAMTDTESVNIGALKLLMEM